jgi:hypothetical protein
MTDRARYIFTAKEPSTGEPWVMAEPCEAALPVFELGTFGFELMQGSSFEDAQTVAMYLNVNGHWDLPSGGRENCPLMATGSAQ